VKVGKCKVGRVGPLSDLMLFGTVLVPWIICDVFGMLGENSGPTIVDMAGLG